MLLWYVTQISNCYIKNRSILTDFDFGNIVWSVREKKGQKGPNEFTQASFFDESIVNVESFITSKVVNWANIGSVNLRFWSFSSIFCSSMSSSFVQNGRSGARLDPFPIPISVLFSRPTSSDPPAIQTKKIT
jgi:hypothetical protein